MYDCDLLKVEEGHLDLEEILRQWFSECDRSEQACIGLFYNKMHVIGMKICIVLSKSNDILEQSHNIQASVYQHMPYIRINNKAFSDFSWADIVDTISALQLSFNEYLLSANNEMEMSLFVTYLMASIGKWLSLKMKRKTSNIDIPKYCIPDDAGFIAPEPLIVTQVLDALHTIGSTVFLLSSAHNSTQNQDAIIKELTEHHRECSLDKFYEISMAVDLPAGSITQYKHRHRENFHSLTQVVYYNWPSYTRKRQESLKSILQDHKPINMLPLLHEMFPDVPILYEHTGALLRSEHSKHAYAWVILSGTIALVTADYRFIISDNIASMAAMILESGTR